MHLFWWYNNGATLIIAGHKRSIHRDNTVSVTVYIYTPIYSIVLTQSHLFLWILIVSINYINI